MQARVEFDFLSLLWVSSISIERCVEISFILRVFSLRTLQIEIIVLDFYLIKRVRFFMTSKTEQRDLCNLVWPKSNSDWVFGWLNNRSASLTLVFWTDYNSCNKLNISASMLSFSFTNSRLFESYSTKSIFAWINYPKWESFEILR